MRYQGAKTCAPDSDRALEGARSRNGLRALRRPAGAALAVPLLLALAFDPAAALADEEPRGQAAARSAGETRHAAPRTSAPAPRPSAPAATPSRPSGPSRTPAARTPEDRVIRRGDDGAARVPDDRRGERRDRAERRHDGRHGDTGWYPYGYYPGFYGGFWSSIWWGYYGFPWYEPYGYGPYGHYGRYGRYGRYGGYGSDRRGSGYDMGALDLDVSPAKTEAWLDGEYIGRVDSFDGFPQYLWLEEGTYDLALYRDGYQTIARQVTVRPGVVIQIEHELERGESTRPEDLPAKTHERRDRRLRYEREAQERAREWDDDEDDNGREMEDDEDADDDEEGSSVEMGEGVSVGEDVRIGEDRGERREARGEPGRVRLDVQPDDASVYLDGRFLGTGSELARLHSGLLVDRGAHSLAVVRPGYRQRELQFVVEPGEDLELEVELEPGG